MADDDVAQPPPPVARSGAREWTAAGTPTSWPSWPTAGSRCLRLAPAAAGTLSWLRASVSRFANGAEHRQRRARAVAELRLLAPASCAGPRPAGRAVMTAAAGPGQRFDAMALLARRVPMAVMAAWASRVRRMPPTRRSRSRPADFPGSIPRRSGGPTRRRRGCAGLLSPAGADVTAARIALMVQGCDATAGLIGLALHLLQDTRQAAPAGRPTAALDQVLWLSPAVRASRRTARVQVRVNGGTRIGAGDTVVCDIEAAHRDPAARRPSASGGAAAVPDVRVRGSGRAPAGRRPWRSRPGVVGRRCGNVPRLRPGSGSSTSRRRCGFPPGWRWCCAEPPAGRAQPRLTSRGVADTVRDWHSLV